MSDFEALLMFKLYPVRRALCRIVAVLDHGRRAHPDDDGFRAPRESHIDRARKHLELLAAGDRGEDPPRARRNKVADGTGGFTL